MNRKLNFVLLQFLCAFFLFAYYFAGPNDFTLALMPVLIICLFKGAMSRAWPALMFSSVILAATALPLIAAIYFGDSLVLLSAARRVFHSDYNLRVALYVVGIQLMCLLSFSQLHLNQGQRVINEGREIVRRPEARRHFRALSTVILLLLSVLSNPSHTIFTGVYGTETFHGESFLIGGWPIIFVAYYSYYAVVTQLQRRFDYLLSITLIGFWLVHGSRSEVLGIVVIVCLAFLANAKSRKHANGKLESLKMSFRTAKLSRLFAAMFALVVGVAAFQFIGTIRSMTAEDIQSSSYYDLLGGQQAELGVVGISTVGPAVYSLVASIGLIESGHVKYQYGGTYIDYLLRTFPSTWDLPFERPDDMAEMLMAKAQTLGGVHFGAEAYINFGVYGAYGFALLYGLFLRWLILRSRRSVLFATFNVVFIMLAPRVIWYGNIYLYKALLLMFLLYVLFNLVPRSRKSTVVLNSGRG